MMVPDKILFETEMRATGGRDGKATSPDGGYSLALSVPKGLGGPGGEGTNPEQLFAAGYAACFLGAVKLVARQMKVALFGRGRDHGEGRHRPGRGRLRAGGGTDGGAAGNRPRDGGKDPPRRARALPLFQCHTRQRGREAAACVRRGLLPRGASHCSGACALPPPLTLPSRGRGTDAVSPEHRGWFCKWISEKRFAPRPTSPQGGGRTAPSAVRVGGWIHPPAADLRRFPSAPKSRAPRDPRSSRSRRVRAA